MTQYPDFLTTIFDKCNKAEVVETIGVDELKIHLWSEERGYINWLRKYLGPLMQTIDEDGRDFEDEFKVGVFFLMILSVRLLVLLRREIKILSMFQIANAMFIV